MSRNQKEQELDYEYDDDVFSLDEDLLKEQKKHFIQYISVALSAALVFGLAVFGSIKLTEARIMSQEKAEIAPEVQLVQTPVEALTEWPSAQFADVPPIPSDSYKAVVTGARAEIELDKAAAERFNDYIARLADDGAVIYVRSPKLAVLSYHGVEIHLITTGQDAKAVLCAEQRYNWSDPNYAAFVLPTVGRLVSVDEGAGAQSRVLTYRDATVTQALSYLTVLSEAGWTLSGSLEPTNNMFRVAYKKNNLQITVDYYQSDDNFTVRLDYLN